MDIVTTDEQAELPIMSSTGEGEIFHRDRCTSIADPGPMQALLYDLPQLDLPQALNAVQDARTVSGEGQLGVGQMYGAIMPAMPVAPDCVQGTYDHQTLLAASKTAAVTSKAIPRRDLLHRETSATSMQPGARKPVSMGSTKLLSRVPILPGARLNKAGSGVFLGHSSARGLMDCPNEVLQLIFEYVVIFPDRLQITPQ